MSTILEALTSQGFIQSALTLLLTAALTGLLVPIVKSKMDDRSYRDRKKFEEDLARQGKLVDYQSKLLDELADSLWQYQSLVLEPTYYKERANEEGYKAAAEHYDQKAPILLAQIRSQVSKVRRFASDEVYTHFMTLYREQLIPLDGWLVELIESGKSSHGDLRWNVLLSI